MQACACMRVKGSEHAQYSQSTHDACVSLQFVLQMPHDSGHFECMKALLDSLYRSGRARDAEACVSGLSVARTR